MFPLAYLLRFLLLVGLVDKPNNLIRGSIKVVENYRVLE